MNNKSKNSEMERAEVSPAHQITMVLLPGMHGSGQVFAPLVREMPDYIRTVALSYPPDLALDYAGYLDIVMAALPDDQPFVLLGESFSGPLALMAAARHPKGLCGVILCATFATWPLSFAPSIARLILALGVFRLKSTRLFLRAVLGRNATGELKRQFSETLTRTKVGVFNARARAVINVDCTAALRDCPVPLLILVSDHDRIVAEPCTDMMQNIRPDAETVHFGTPHLILQYDPVAAVGVICGFVEKVRSNMCHPA